MDTAKAAAAMATHPGQITDYMGANKLVNERLPLVAVPTTAGTGSEATRSSIITDPVSTVKMLILDWKLVPDAAIVDPLFTLSLPPKVTADSGVDALTHAVEAYISVRRNPTSDALALDAIKEIRTALPRAWADGQDREARSAMMIAAHHAGIAFCNSSVALVHAMSRPIGAHFGVAHGLSNAMLLPAVMRYTAPALPDRFKQVALAFGLDVEHAAPLDAAQRFVESIADFCEQLRVPTLTGAGLPRDRLLEVLPQMAIDALNSGSADNHPRVPPAEEIVELYKQAL
jgi:alcohol dehydrogenase class IV